MFLILLKISFNSYFKKDGFFASLARPNRIQPWGGAKIYHHLLQLLLGKVIRIRSLFPLCQEGYQQCLSYKSQDSPHCPSWSPEHKTSWRRLGWATVGLQEPADNNNGNHPPSSRCQLFLVFYTGKRTGETLTTSASCPDILTHCP